MLKVTFIYLLFFRVDIFFYMFLGRSWWVRRRWA